MQIRISKDKFLPVYHHLLDKSKVFDIEFLYGGRDSGKSRHIAMQLVLDCISIKGFKCLMVRKVLNTVRDSQYSLIQSVIDIWGLSHLFKFNSSRLEIICKLNGSGFYGRGLDEVARIKSFNNPSACWIEEGNQIDKEDFVVVLTSLRSNDLRVKTWFSFNPESEVNYTDFWLYQEYFEHTDELAFEWNKNLTVMENGVEKTFEFKIRATHSTYKDNKYCSPQRQALYESYANSKSNSYWYQTYTLGLWGYRKTGDEFWKCFDEFRHTGNVEAIDSTFHLVFDSNVNPYVSIQFWQIDTKNKRLLQVLDMPCKTPANTAAKAAMRAVSFLQKIGYEDVVYIYGDPSANARSTQDDEGRSFFEKVLGVFKRSQFTVVDRVGRSAPSVSMSGAFINELYESEFGGWSIMIDKSCRKSIEDYNMAKEDIDGKMLKKKELNKETKVSFERYGHFSDCKRYFIIKILGKLYRDYLNRMKGTTSSKPEAVDRVDTVTP